MPGDAGAPFKFVDRHWRWWTTLFWLCASAIFIAQSWARIKGFSLGLNALFVFILTAPNMLAGPWWWPLIPILFVTPLVTFSLNRLWVFA